MGTESKLAWIPLLVALAAALGHVSLAQVVERAVIVIRADGVAVAEVSGSVAGGVVNEIALPADPIPESFEVYVGGTLVPTIYVNGSLVVPSETSASFLAKYVVSTAAAGNELKFSVRGDGEVVLVAEPGVVLTSLPERILDTRIEDGKLILTFAGPAEISYTLAEAPPVEGVPAVLPVDLRLAALAAAAVFAILIIFLRFRRPPKSAKRELDDTDEAILRKLEELGGSALQSELQDALKVPKTTLWRHVKRLERLGYVRVEREDRANRVLLKAKV